MSEERCLAFDLRAALDRGETVHWHFKGVEKETGETAMVQRTCSADYAQFDRLSHPKSHGWWQYPIGHFSEIRKTVERVSQDGGPKHAGFLGGVI